MKYILILVVTFSMVFAKEFYSDEYNKFDWEAISKDDQQLLSHLNCILDRGPCESIMEQFKKDLPEVIRQACAKCNAEHKRNLKIFLTAAVFRFPEESTAIAKIVDPEAKYFPGLLAAIV